MHAPTRSTALHGVVLVALLGSLFLLVQTGLATLTAWTTPFVPVSRYPALFASFLLTWILVRLARSPRSRRHALLVGSLVCAAVFDPGFLAISLLWVTALHRVLFGGVQPRVRLAFAFVIASHLVFAIACSRDLWPEFLDEYRCLPRWAYLFVLSYTFRIAWLLHQVRVQPLARVALVDLTLYFVFAPFFVIVPYMVAIPRCDRFCAGLDSHDVAIERSGLRMMAWGVVFTLAVALVRHVFDPQTLSVSALAERSYGAALFYGLLYYPPQAVLIACAISSILIGMIRVLGIDLKPSFDRPLVSTSITEWWRRWNTHFRDLLVDIFYYPIVMRHRRRPVRGIVLGCASVFLVGSVLFHYPRTYFGVGHVASIPAGLIAESAVMFVVVAVALVLERRKLRAVIARATPHISVRIARTALRVLTTWVLVFAAIVLAGYGTQQAWSRLHPMTHIVTMPSQESPR